MSGKEMGQYDFYKEKLEKRFDKSIKDILVEYYIVKELGPSVGAKQLKIPRQVFVHYCNLFRLKELRNAEDKQGHQLCSK
ncbi:hypothetical protein [Planococcus salinus]|uniref:Uncharacterized protein n=1 Tax=Planococcus salinus TaxID=1848460 RepID=A0A3M8P7G8_9BACL|nr:hypothetical protein [Planococcus salinus]RNF39638.1 hypothetical protein EEX84_09210 [Planococcus salinus]